MLLPVNTEFVGPGTESMVMVPSTLHVGSVLLDDNDRGDTLTTDVEEPEQATDKSLTTTV